MLKPYIVWMKLFVLMVAGVGAASAQTYPIRTIRIITAEAGGGNDLVSRLIAQGITGPLGQPVIVENRSTAVVGGIGAKASPDGYTMVSGGNTFFTSPLLQQMPYDAIRDFSPVSLTTRQPNYLVVHPSTSVKTVKELIALAKTKPGTLNYGSSGVGGSGHLAGALFGSMAGINIVHVAYKGNGPALNALIGGEIQLIFATGASGVLTHVKAGKLVALGISSTEPSVLAPGLPTVASSGLPGYESASVLGFFVPAKTPVGIINRLNEEIVRFLTTPAVKEKLLNMAIEVVATTPQQFSIYLKSDMGRMAKLIKDIGLKAE